MSRPRRAPRWRTHRAVTGTRPAAGGANDLIFTARTRWTATAAAVVVGTAIVWWSATLTVNDDNYLLAHAVAALPFLVAATVVTGRVRRSCPPEYEGFWRPWWWAVALGIPASVAAILGAALHADALVGVDLLLLGATIPLWVVATLRMLDAQAGRLDPSVDLLDAAMALVVLGAPGVLLLGESVVRSDDLGFAIPFAVTMLLTPAVLYVSFVNLGRIPRGERAAQGIGLALAAAFTVNITLQLARVLAHIHLELPVFVGFHVTQMILIMALPLWAHRHPTARLARLGPEDQVRASPMPYVSAAVLPVLAVFVFLTRDERPWGVAYLCLVLLAVIVLNAVRFTLMSRETRRLSAELTEMAEDRRRLLANMVRALEDDRHRTVAELHTQAVGALATLASIIQTAYDTLPTDTAQAVRDTITTLQGDLSDRAEELRQLMVAMRPPRPDAAGEPPADGDADESTLGTALLAYASELYRGRSTRTVSVRVDPGLELDRSTMMIVYRIAQEALLNAAHHARAGAVSVGVTAHDGGVLVEVRDDGIGFEPGAVVPGTGLGTMQMFANLGRGELVVRSAPGEGTVVRSVLRLRGEGGPHAPAASPGRLRLVPAPDTPV